MNHELEKAVLSCILLDSSLINKLIINEECFLDDTYKFIFKLLLKQYNDFKTIDAVGLINALSEIIVRNLPPFFSIKSA